MALSSIQPVTLPLTLTDSAGNNVNIVVRKADGYVDATKLCADSKKKWKDYYMNAKTKDFLQELSVSKGIPIENPEGRNVTTSSNHKYLVTLGINRHVHTWVHPQIAIDLSRWASSRFSVSVTELIMRYQTGQVTTEESVAASHQLAEQVDMVDEEEEAPEVPEPPNYVTKQILQDRMDAIAVTNAKNRVIRETFPQTGPWEYATLANLSNQIALNFTSTTSAYKKKKGIPARMSIPDICDEVGLSRRTIAEAGFAIFMKTNEADLKEMTNSDRIAAYKQRQQDLQKATDIFDPRTPGLLTVTAAKRNRSELDVQRKKQCIEPSARARNLISY